MVVCVEVKHDAVLPSKIFLSKCSAFEGELIVEVEVELPGKQARRGHNSALCHSQSASRPKGRNLDSRGTPISPYMDKRIGVQQNGPGIASDLGQPDVAMRSEVPDELVPVLDQPELGLAIDGVCIEDPVCRVVLDPNLKPQNKAPNVSVVRFASEVLFAEAPSSASHCWQLAPCSRISHLVVNCCSKLAPVVAEEIPVVAGPMMAPFPIGTDRVEKENAPLVNMSMINHCPQGGLGVDGKFPVPLVIKDPISSVLSKNLQLDDRPPADAESNKFLDTVSSPNPHASPADQHGKAPGVLSRGLGAAAEGLPGAGADPISIRPSTDAARMEALGPRAATIMMEPFFPACAVAAMDAIPSSFPTKFEFEEDPAVVASHSPHDAQFIHYDLAPALEVDLDLTPNSISRLSSKYFLNTSSNVGPDSISPRGSLADVQEGRALDTSRVKYYRAKDVIAMQYGPWKPAKSQRQRKSTPKNFWDPPTCFCQRWTLCLL